MHRFTLHCNRFISGARTRVRVRTRGEEIFEMKPLIFYKKVCEMRMHQKAWFKCHSYEALRKARIIEREIDAEIERVEALYKEKYEPKQGKLFQE